MENSGRNYSPHNPPRARTRLTPDGLTEERVDGIRAAVRDSAEPSALPRLHVRHLPSGDRAGETCGPPRLPLGLDCRASFSQRVVILVGARSLVRRAQPGDEQDSARPRHLPAADSVQPSGARSRANRRARHHVERARRVRLGPINHRAGTRRLPGQPGRLARDVGRGGRGDTENVDAGDVQPRRQVFQDAGARGDTETDSETASADVGGGDAAVDLGSRGAKGNRRARVSESRNRECSTS